MYCTNCGKEINENMKFCANCGNPLTNKYISSTTVQPVIYATRNIADNQQIETRKEIPQGRPWVRFFARNIDFIFLAVSIGFVVELAFQSGLISQEPYDSIFNLSEFSFFIFILFIMIFIEPIFLSSWGTTPGKWLFKTIVRTSDGKKLTFSQGFGRTASVGIKGYALGIPLLSFITLLIAYDNITQGSASWDKGKFVVLHERIGALRTALIIFIYIIIILIALSEQPGSTSMGFDTTL